MTEVQALPATADAIAAYNYAVFPPPTDHEHFRNFPRVLEVGPKAPDFEATLLDGGSVRLSDYTRRGPTVIEFGALT